MPDIYLRQGAANPTDVILRDPTLPDVSYFGILKRWTGSLWAKAKLMIYTGTWQAKKLYRWNGSEWKEIDATGI